MTLAHRLALAAACLLLALPAAAMTQQPVTVTGRVTGDDGAPLPAATVFIEGLGLGAQTRDDGRYSILVPASRASGQQATLTARRIGYRPTSVTVTLAGVVTHDFTLAAAPSQLEGVVVTALGIERQRRELGTAVQSVKGEELAEARETNIVNALAGKISGLEVTNAGPQGGSARVVIRGANSIAGNNQPLFVVDGVPISNRSDIVGGFGGYDYGNAAQDINPNDVESVSVLKGPNAAALYGSRAANGVIVITTKSGKSSRGVGITATSNMTFESPLRLPRYQNQYGQGAAGEFEFVDGAGGGVNDGVDESWGPAFDGQPRAQFFGVGPWVASPNNVRDFFETGRTWTNSVGLSGSTERANVRLSLTNQNVGGVFPGNELEKWTASLNGGAQLAKRLNATASMQYIKSDGTNRPGTGYDVANPMEQFVWFGRQVDIKKLKSYRDANGHQLNWNYNYHNNPYWISHENQNNDRRDRIIGTGAATYQLASWLSATGRLGTDWYREGRKLTIPSGSIGEPFGINDQTGGFFETLLFNQETNSEFLLNANRKLTSVLGLDLTFGGNRRVNDFRTNNEGTTELIVPGTYNIGNSAVKPTVSAYEERRRVNSLYGRAGFAFNDYLFLEATGRNDWSSTLPTDNNSYFYPSVSGSLIFTDAVPALSLGNRVSYGKLRGGWSRVGNDARPYQLQLTYNPGTPFGGIARYAFPNVLPNTNLKPEETTSWEVGTELGFFDNRLGLDATYYNKATTDQILTAQVSGASGFTNVVVNAGKITNKGLELQLNATPVRLRGGFEWNVTANFGKNQSNVAELYGDLQTVTLGSYWSLTVEARKGSATEPSTATRCSATTTVT